MKKILITLLAIVLLSGCGKTKEPDPELLDCVKSAVLNYLNENGYDEDDKRGARERIRDVHPLPPVSIRRCLR